jgi:hypothetical protein
MIHELKIWPKFYCRVADGSKTFEVRDNDRGFQPGDVVILKEWDPENISATAPAPKGFTESPPLTFTVGYVLVLDKERVVFSLLPPKPKPKSTLRTKA